MFKPRFVLWARAIFYHLSSGLTINSSGRTDLFSWLRFVVLFVPFVNCLRQMTSFFFAFIMALKLTQYKILFCNDYGDVNENDKEKTVGLDWQNNNFQGHPTTVFCKISVRRSKNCLEFSIAWGRLRISRWPFHSCIIFEAYLVNSLRFSEV